MTSASQPDADQLWISKPGLYTAIVAAVLLVETFSGALRFYFDLMGIAPLLYLPKLACVAVVALELPHLRVHRGVWLTLLLTLTAAVLALMHGAAPENIGFTLFALGPLLFGVVCGRHLQTRMATLSWIIGFCLVASLVGLVLDKFTEVPWKGYSYMMGETEVSGNRAWGDGDQDRPAGFARMSTTLSVMIAIYSLFLAVLIRSRVARMVLYAVSLAGIFASTNKSTLAAYVLTLAMMLIACYRLPSASASLVAVLTGLALPLVSLVLNIDPHTVAGASDHPLASLNDRLANSWPNLFALLADEGWLWTGAGFGAVGSTQAAFPVPGQELLTVADNTALYLWATFGAFGVLLYLTLFPLLLRLQESGSAMRLALLLIVFCISLIGWTTDILEVPAASLFLGMGAGLVLAPAPVRRQRSAAKWNETVVT